MREALFGLGEPPPEPFRPSLQRTLIIYAYLTWVYRFFLFLGIAAIVYVVAGKALGIFLALVEIGFFIVRPIWNEVAAWWGLRSRIAISRRSLVTGSVVMAGLVLSVAPVIRGVDSPGVLVSLNEQDLYLPVSATLTRVTASEGGYVELGQVLFEAQSPDLDQRLRTARLELRLLELQMSRLAASAKELEQAVVLGRAEAAARQKIEGLEAERRALTVRAPFTGRIVDFDLALRPGTSVAKEQLLARITSAEGGRVKALVSDTDLQRIAAGARGVFVPDEADLASFPVTLQSIAPASNGVLAEPALADRFGGVVAAVEKDQQLNTREGWVDVVFQVDHGQALPQRLMRGNVWVEGDAVSPLALAWRQIGRVLVREQGF
jgi:putative peptide zinc metalloprotease protein